MADSTRIKQVMINLGSNAGYAMREKGGELDIILTRDDVSEQEAERISPDLKAGTYVRIMVRDTGEGMDGPTMQRIFEPFFTTKKQGEGSGMGLSVVHGIVKEHQGAISVWSRPGRGSTFSVWLPVVKEGDRGRRTGAKSGRVETRSSRYGL
jgi:signal transduction histidine kinase